MDFKQKVVDLVSEQVDLPKEKIAMLIERPKNAKMGDYAFPAFALAKIEHKNKAKIEKEKEEKMPGSSGIISYPTRRSVEAVCYHR